MATFSIAITQSCAIKELHNISVFPDAETIVKHVAKTVTAHNNFYRANPAFLLFSGVTKDRVRKYETWAHEDRSDNYGQALADYILANGLGTVSASQEAVNHNGNTVRVWLWAPGLEGWAALKAIYDAQVAPPSLAVEPAIVNFIPVGQTAIITEPSTR